MIKQDYRRQTITTLGLLFLTLCSGFILASHVVSADDVIDDFSININVSCTLFNNVGTAHTAEVPNGTYETDIGTTTIKAYCNDTNGFSIYAIGYTGEEYGNNTLVGTNNSSTIIATGTAVSGDTSNWAMKLGAVSGTYTPTILNSFNNFHAVPDTYTQVAKYTSGTDVGTTMANANGSSITTTYASYISYTQAADTYVGKVKYTLVHPNDASTPVTCAPNGTTISTISCMQDISSTNKSTILSSMTLEQQYTLKDKRDGKTYTVSKLNDGNIWMTQNLDHDIVTDGSVIYDNTTTDLGWNGSNYNTASWIPSIATYATSTTTWNNSYFTPESYDPGELYWNGVTTNDYSDNNNQTSITGDSSYYLGNFYNWTAAVAMNDSSSFTTQYTDVDQSICPAGWTLPKSGNDTSSGSFQYLFEQYGLSGVKITDPNVWDTPIETPLSGYWDGLLRGVGRMGVFLSPVVGQMNQSTGVHYSHNANIEHNGYVLTSTNYSRGPGYSIRCVAR